MKSERLRLRLAVVAALAAAVCAIRPADRPRSTSLEADVPFRFAVIGDNRYVGAAAPPTFRRIVERLTRDAPDLILHTGDLIDGYPTSDDADLQRQWDLYLGAIAAFKAPFFHAPGNHDIFDARSARIWRERLGAPYYAFDRGPARFVVLDTETETGRIAPAQLSWLERQLEDAGSRHVFVALHRPLFPIDGHIGSSLDEFPEDRDRLHALFVRHRAAIKGVFQGHEHLYNFEARDGIPYYTIAGAGAEPYVPPELGGFHHYALVRVTAKSVTVTLEKLTAQPPSTSAPGVVTAGPIESWEAPAFWYTWDHAVARRPTSQHATDGLYGLQLWFDFSLSEPAVLYTFAGPSQRLDAVETLSVDLYVPEELGTILQVRLAVEAGSRYEGPAIPLKAGWNTVVTSLSGDWLPAAARDRIRQIDWRIATAGQPVAGWIVFDNFRAEARGGQPIQDAAGSGLAAPMGRIWSESWEAPLLWGAWDPALEPESTPAFSTHRQRGLRVPYGAATRRQVLYATPTPSWDLRQVAALAADIYAPPDGRAVDARLALGGPAGRYESPSQRLRTGWNQMRAALQGAWLPPDGRRDIDRVEWIFSPAPGGPPGWVVIDNFRAEGP